MESPLFVRQTDQPLYPKLLWNRPVTRHGAGRLLIIGGHVGEFSYPTSLYGFAMAAGAGECRVIVPDRLIKTLAGVPGVYFVPSTASGSLSKGALGAIIDASETSDTVLLGGSLSNNSDTSILVERITRRLDLPLVLYGDSLTALQLSARIATDNPNNLLIVTMSDLFKIAGVLKIPIRLQRDGGVMNKLEILQSVQNETKCRWVLYGTEIIIADDDLYTVTPIPYLMVKQSAVIIAVMATFWTQHPSAPLEGLTMGAYILAQAAKLIGEGPWATHSVDQALRATLGRVDLAE